MAHNFSDAINNMMISRNELMIAAMQTHALFESYLQAGFTEEQALKLIVYIMKQQ